MDRKALKLLPGRFKARHSVGYARGRTFTRSHSLSHIGGSLNKFLAQRLSGIRARRHTELADSSCQLRNQACCLHQSADRRMNDFNVLAKRPDLGESTAPQRVTGFAAMLRHLRRATSGDLSCRERGFGQHSRPALQAVSAGLRNPGWHFFPGVGSCGATIPSANQSLSSLPLCAGLWIGVRCFGGARELGKHFVIRALQLLKCCRCAPLIGMQY
mmetsp:Transcript_42675/g.124009  ORF Transcript_42675/g.124009 Transcript_42675/m.124009 type:complete len:215 (+) Transcript_42675:819-1463(+)